MWDCKRLWLLFIALLYIKDVRALGVWSKRPAQDWYSVAAQIPLAQPKEPAPLHDGAQISTAMRDEGLQSQNIVSYAQATSNQDVSNTALQNSYGTQSVRLQSGNTVYSSMYQQRPQVPSTSQTSQSWMQNASSYSGSQSQTSTGYGLSQGFASQYVGQSSAIPAFIVTQPASDGTVFSGSTSSTSSSSNGSQSPSVYWQSPSSFSSQYLGSQGQQNVNQVSSASGLTTTQQAAPSIVSSGSTSSTSSSSNGSQSPSVYWQSPSSLSSQYLGSQGQQNVNQVSSASGLTITQQAAPSIVSSGSTSSTSSSSNGSQSPSVYWQSPSSQSQSSTGYGLSQWLASRYGGFQTWPDQNQLSSAPALTLTQQVAESGMSSGPTTSGMSSIAYSGFQSPSTSWLSGISKPTSTLTQQGINQHGSVPRLTVIQPAADIAVSNGSASSTSSSYSCSPSSTSSGQSLSSLGSHGQQSINQMSSAPGLTMTQQSTQSIDSSGSTSSTSSSSSGSQSQPSTSYGLSQWLANQYGKFQTQQGTNEMSSAPGLTVTQQSMPNVASSTSSSSSGSQSPSTYWQSPSSLSSQYLGSQGQSVNQLTSAPDLTVVQPASDSAVSNDSATSMLGSYTSSQSPSTYWQSPSSLFTQYLGSQGQQNVNQVAESGMSSGPTTSGMSSIAYSGFQSPSTSWLSGISKPTSTLTQQGINQHGSVPRLTVIQPAADIAVSNGSASSTSSSYSCSPSSTSSGQSLSSLGSHGQQSINQMSSAPGLTMTQQSTQSIDSSGSTSSTSSSSSGSQSQPSTSYGLSQWLANQYGKFQTQQGTNEMSSAPGLTVTQQSMPNVASSTSSSSSGSQSPSTYWQSPSSLSSQYLGSQGQSVNQLTSAPDLTVVQPASDSAVSNDSATSMLGSYTSSQSPSTYWQSPSSLFTQYLGSQGQQNVNQVSSASGLTTTQQAVPSVVSSGSTSTFTGSQSPSTSWLVGLSKPTGSFQTQHGISQLGSVPGFTGIQPALVSALSNGSISTSSSSSGSQSPSTYWPSQSSGINQLSSAPGLTVTQQAVPSVASSGSASSTSSSSSASQSPSAYWQSASSFSSQYLGSQGQQNVNQVSSASGLTTQQVAPSIFSSGSASSSYTGSQSQDSTGYGTFQVLASQHGGFQTPHGTNLSSAPSLTLILLPSDTAVTNGSIVGTLSSYGGSQSQGSTVYGLSQGLPSQPGRLQMQQGINQMNSTDGLTTTQQVTPSVVLSGSTSSTSSSSSDSESPFDSWQSASLLSSQYLGSQGQQNVNQVSSASGLTTTQQPTPSIVSSGSTSSTSSSSSGSQSPSVYWQSPSSQSQNSTGYGLSQWLVSRYGSFEMWPENQLSSAPALTMTQQVAESGMSSGSTTSGISSIGSQSPSASWLSGIFKPTDSTRTQQGINQLASVSNGSTVNASGAYGVFHIQSPSANWQSPSSLFTQYPGSQGQQNVNQVSSASGLTTTQQTAVTNGSIVGTLSSYGGSQSQGSTVYGLSQGLPSQPGRLQMQQGINQMNSTDGLTTTQQVTPSVVLSGSTSSTSSSSSDSESPFDSWQSASLLSSQYLGSQGQQNVNQVSSASGLTTTQQAVPSVVSSGTSTSGSPTGFQSQSTSGYWSSQGLSNHHDGLQTQGTQQLNQQASSTLTSSGPNVSTSNTTTSNLGIQSKNVPKPQAFNLWMGRYSCKSGSSSNASKLS
ncbi:A-agglutinin anchorage subunit [Tachysurus ichikawai]